MCPHPTIRTASQSSAHKRRKGAAVVELAVTLPVLVLFVFAILEIGDVIVLKQSLTEAAYETARAAIETDTSQHMAEDRGKRLLRQLEVADGTITFDPNPTSAQTRGTPLTVTVTAPVGRNTIGAVSLFRQFDVSSSVKMVKE